MQARRDGADHDGSKMSHVKARLPICLYCEKAMPEGGIVDNREYCSQDCVWNDELFWAEDDDEDGSET